MRLELVEIALKVEEQFGMIVLDKTTSERQTVGTVGKMTFVAPGMGICQP